MYNQFSNYFMNDLLHNAEDLIRMECIGIASKMHFPLRTTSHQHIIPFFQYGISEGIDHIYSIKPAEIIMRSGLELQELVQTFEDSSPVSVLSGEGT